ncbi:TonB-dependent receptor plug domain-containing protein [Zoogloea sp.]|uniref:TonB-dependent receptor plug domain-containing protein n=1 Tax=Zoogloea sp. TaxID=49181 RepID=UPI0035B0C119
MRRYRLPLFVALALSVQPAWADDAFLADLALEELARLDVATVSRKTQKLSETPAAVTVLTAEDIRRSGARSVPEALREVPGVSVAQIGAGRWAVGVRMAEGRYSNKLLVQIDGRSVYNPLFSGVFWESLDLPMEDIERIEVVRGPGASLWGANAVMGVINIVTRKATATRGSLVSARLDDKGRPALAVRHGFDIEGVGAMRVFAKGSELMPSRTADGQSASDRNQGWSAGFRMDSVGAATNAWTVQGNSFRRTTDERLVTTAIDGTGGLFPLNLTFEGASLLGRYSWGLLGGEASVQAYYDNLTASIGEYGHGGIGTFDVDFQHRLAPAGRHELMWGGGARYVKTDIDTATPILVLSPVERSLQVMSAFVQDEITLAPRTWKLTLGARLEHSTLSHFEPQPTARLMWTPTEADSLWTSWSRAARTPSVGEVGASILYGLQRTGNPLLPVVFARTAPGPGWEPRAERVDALELGYRRSLRNGSFEAVLFHHDYRRLVGDYLDPAGLTLPGFPLPVPPYYVPIQNIYRGNVGKAHSTGVELGLDVPVSERLRFQASYTRVDLKAARSSDPVTAAAGARMEDASPRYWGSVHGVVNLARGHELDLMARRVGAIAYGNVPAYTAIDLRYGWRPGSSFELTVMGLNLFDRWHMEYMSNFLPTQSAYMGRQAYVQGVWRF